ncbi:MAG TPA: WecB/TagA/CpsF family glycosyltransferase [Actinomycetota bacterium]|nr:WecB/TagA/CpsF family glycosyltransferase [Actinomycetota bacterium]
MSDIHILGVPLARLNRRDALDEMARLYERDDPALVAYANAHTLNLATADPAYKELLLNADLVLNDGSGVSLAAWIQSSRFPENLNGSDLNPLIVELAAQRGWPVFFLGGRAGVADRAAGILKDRNPALKVAGTASGYFEDPQHIAKQVREAGTGLLMVAMGNPVQEVFLRDHLASTGARLGIGVGAFFDFTAGVVPRAPAWMNKAGIEWIYRLAQEPRRMWRRYVVGNPVFLWRAMKERLRR